MGGILVILIIIIVLVHIGLDAVMEEIGKFINMFRRNK